MDADVKGLIKEERNDIVGEWVEEWVEEWRGSPKNGHTTYLLMSFRRMWGRLIPIPIELHPCAHGRKPMVVMHCGCSMS